LVEWRLAGETEVLGENLPQRLFVHHKIPHGQTRAWTPDHSGGAPATNRLSYGAAQSSGLLFNLEYGGHVFLRNAGCLRSTRCDIPEDSS
jgi:hypothetical protein